MQSSRPGSLTSFAKGISELLPLGIATGKLVGGNCPTYEARVVYLDRFDSRSIRALFECKLSTLCTLIYCHDLSCSISIHVKERFVQKYSSHVSITVPQATCTQGHRFTSSCQCAKDRPFCVYILMFFSLRLSYTRNKMSCIYLCKYIPTLFNNIHEYHVQKEELWHISPRKKNWHRIPIKHLFLMQQKLPFLRFFFPRIPQGSWFAKALHHSALPRKGHSPDPKKRKSPAHRHDRLIQRWTVTVERRVTASSKVFFWKKHNGSNTVWLKRYLSWSKLIGVTSKNDWRWSFWRID